MDSIALANPWIMGMLFLFLGMLVGYAVGRRTGRHEGLAEGLGLAPINLRRAAWEEGRCSICGTESCNAAQSPSQLSAAGESATADNCTLDGQEAEAQANEAEAGA